MAEHQEAVMHMPTVWTDYPLGKTTVRDWIFPHEFEGSEPTPDIAWTLTDDTLTMSGYLCQQATATHRGVEWRVWYTEEIPSSAGPWRLRGLPGMIVQAENEAHTFCLNLHSLERLASYKLPDASLNAIKRTQNQNRTPDSSRLPTSDRLQIRQYCIEPLF